MNHTVCDSRQIYILYEANDKKPVLGSESKPDVVSGQEPIIVLRPEMDAVPEPKSDVVSGPEMDVVSCPDVKSEQKPDMVSVPDVIQGQPRQTGFFELALRDRNMQVKFFWKVFLKS